MTAALEKLKILLAHGNSATRLILRQTLESLGHEVMADCESPDCLLAHCLQNSPDLILSSVELVGGDGLTALVEMSKIKPIPAVIITQQRSLDLVEKAMHDHVMAYMMEPLNLAEIEPTIYLVLRRFEQFEALRQEVVDLKQAMLDRKVIERAKGILMVQHQEPEEDAYKRLRRMATDQRARMVDIAEKILSNFEKTTT